MKTPAQKYIDVLLLGRFSTEEIVTEMKSLGYLANASEIKNRYTQLCIEQQDYFNDVNLISPDIDWLEQNEIDRMFGFKYDIQVRRPVKPAEQAIKILNDDPKIYRAVTTLALAGVDDDDLQLIVGAKYNIDYEYEDIKEFLTIFFNVKSWTRREKQFLEGITNDNKLKMLWKTALEGDKDHVIWKLGLSPDRSFDAMLRDMGQDCFFHFREKSKGFDPEDAIKWGTLFTRVYDRITKKLEEDEKTNDAFDDISFELTETEQQSIKSINDLEDSDE